MRVPPVAQVDPQESASSGADTAQAEQWSAAQAAAVTAAEAIAATAAAEVAAEAAATAQAAVNVASAAAVKAAAKADEVAARAALAATAAALELLSPEFESDQSRGGRAEVTTTGDVLLVGETPTGAASSAVMVNAAAAAKVALRVAAVAAAAATAAVEAAALIGEQLANDVAAAAAAVASAAHPVLAEPAETLALSCDATPAGHTDIAARTPVPVDARGELAPTEELRRGIAANQLRLHYQPIMNLATGRPVGVEALIRWQHPVRGLLGPLEFVELAEHTDLILPLGAWVLHEACRVAVRLQNRSAGPFTVAVNLSARQLSDRGLVPTVRAALDAHGCTADRLVFEVTETAPVTDMAAAVDSMRELRELGAGVAIDDFGTGYAPLLYLKQLSANDLKIDRSFVDGLGGGSYDTAMVASIISLAHSLNVRCVAEGVETVEQLQLLKQLGCDFAQGYLFSRPVNEQTLNAWLDRAIVKTCGSACHATC